MTKNRWKELPSYSEDELSNKSFMKVIHQTYDNNSCWYEAFVKWDGCIHFNHAVNAPFCEEFGFHDEPKKREDSSGGCDEYIHICDINELIEVLTELRDKSKQYFGEEWSK